RQAAFALRLQVLARLQRLGADPMARARAKAAAVARADEEARRRQAAIDEENRRRQAAEQERLRREREAAAERERREAPERERRAREERERRARRGSRKNRPSATRGSRRSRHAWSEKRRCGSRSRARRPTAAPANGAHVRPRWPCAGRCTRGCSARALIPTTASVWRRRAWRPCATSSAASTRQRRGTSWTSPSRAGRRSTCASTWSRACGRWA